MDDSLFAYQAMDFDVGLMSFPLLAKVLVVVLFLLLLLLVGLGWLLIRKMRRRRAGSTLSH